MNTNLLHAARAFWLPVFVTVTVFAAAAPARPEVGRLRCEWNGADSRNHIMFGDVSAWFYRALAGLQPDPQAPGFRHFFVKPEVVGDLTSARAIYDSIRGRIVSDWKVANGEFRLNLTVPANTSATVCLPVAGPVREGGQPAERANGVKPLRTEGGRTVFEVGSGTYQFSGTLVR